MATKWPSALTNRPSSSVLELLMGVLSTVDPPSEASEAVLFQLSSEKDPCCVPTIGILTKADSTPQK